MNMDHLLNKTKDWALVQTAAWLSKVRENNLAQPNLSQNILPYPNLILT